MTTRDRKSRWIDGMLLDFTRWIHIQQEPVSKDAFIQVLLDRSGKGGIDKVVDGVNCRRSRHRLHSVGQRPSLSTLLNLAALKGVSIQGVLGDAQSWLPDHLFQSEFEFQDFTPRSYERSKYSSTQIGAVLRHVLGSSLPLPPTGLIWHALEIGSINAKTACPKQYAALIERARSEEPLLAKPKMRAGVQIMVAGLSEPGRARGKSLMGKLIALGYTEVQAKACLGAAMNLRQAMKIAARGQQD